MNNELDKQNPSHELAFVSAEEVDTEAQRASDARDDEQEAQRASDARDDEQEAHELYGSD